mmetsp:Transcript_25502/g.73674  ORF Transcript_25502/g.73674 Transcript_25502/m.73674 type:complete len:100 (-) Transcript_25502:1378-1677(-)
MTFGSPAAYSTNILIASCTSMCHGRLYHSMHSTTPNTPHPPHHTMSQTSSSIGPPVAVDKATDLLGRDSLCLAVLPLLPQHPLSGFGSGDDGPLEHEDL